MQINLDNLRIVTDITWILQTLIVAAAWILLADADLKEPASRKKGLGGACFLIGSLFLSAIVLIIFLPRQWFSILWNVALCGVGFLFLKKWSGYKNNLLIAVWCAVCSLILCLMELAGTASQLTGFYIGSAWEPGLARILVYLLMLPTALHIRRLGLARYENIPASGAALIALGTVCAFLFRIAANFLPMVDNEMHTLVLEQGMTYLVILILILMSMQFMAAVCRERAEVLALQVEKQRYLNERQMTELTEQNLKDLRSVRHELKNQYGYMRILLEQKRYEELDDYFEHVQAELPAALSYVDCGNRTVNTILNMEIAKAHAQNIPVKYRLMVPPVLNFPADDLCSLIANILDNALEECVRMREEKKEVQIDLEIYPKESYLFLRCTNPTDREKLDRREKGLGTTKEDTGLHGFGTRIITDIAEKYNGCADFSLEEGRFAATVMLDLT